MDIETDVLIVGCGPAGLSAALALSRHGIDVTAITKYGRLAPTPRAHVTNQRTFEVFRDLGVEADAVAAATDYEHRPNVVYCSTLVGREYARWRPFGTHPDRVTEYRRASPCQHRDLAQDLLEPILHAKAAALGARILFNTQYVRVEQDDDAVRAIVVDRATNAELSIQAKFLIGADGGNSQVARDIGLPMAGPGKLGHSVNVLFDSDLTHLVQHRPAFLYYMLSGNARTGPQNDLGIKILRPTKAWTQWLLTPTWAMTDGRLTVSEDDAIAMVRDAVGVADLPVNIQSIDPWDINSLYATRLHAGRIFCVGDAVHRHAPSNGLGSNTAIQDSYNLAWKMALVLSGVADTSLLHSYTEERAPVGRHVVQRATKSLAIYGPILDAIADDVQNEPGTFDELSNRLYEAVTEERYNHNALGAETNHSYQSAAIIDDGSEPERSNLDTDLFHNRSTRPGHRIPHAWLQRDGRDISSVDLVGHGQFTLITGAGGTHWFGAARAAGKEFGIVIAAHGIDAPDGEVTDLHGEWAAVRNIASSGCLLVRPDGYICLRIPKMVTGGETERVLISALARILGRSPRHEQVTVGRG